MLLDVWRNRLKRSYFITSAISFIVLLDSLSAYAGPGKPFEKVNCPNTKALVHELINSELSGQRFFAAKKDCRDYKNFPNFRSSSYSYGESPGDIDWYQADAKKPYEIKKISESDDDLVLVEFDWHVVDKQNPKKTKTISDVFKFALYAGKMKDEVGCAGVLFAPANIVVKQSCINFDRIKKK